MLSTGSSVFVEWDTNSTTPKYYPQYGVKIALFVDEREIASTQIIYQQYALGVRLVNHQLTAL